MRQIYNPFLPLNEYIPDGEPHVFGDRLYLFGSHDKEGGDAFCMLDYVLYSASVSDLTDWRCEGVIYSSRQDPYAKEGQNYLFAPDVVKGNDGRYYLYYTLDTSYGAIGVAVSDTINGKYSYYGYVKQSDGQLFRERIPFDPGVINDGGVIRLYYGMSLPVRLPKNVLTKGIINWVLAKKFRKTISEVRASDGSITGAYTVVLEDDMITVKSSPKKIVPSVTDAKDKDFSRHGFFEASSIRKIEDIYYFIYSSHVMHELCYATSPYPDKDFIYGGVIISNGDIGYNGRTSGDRVCATNNNHGSIECVNGQWYIFYHRHTHDIPFSRQACAEKITIREDGSIAQVEITSQGLNCKPLESDRKYPAVIACTLIDGIMKHVNSLKTSNKARITHLDDEQFITDIKNKVIVGYKYFSFDGDTKLTLECRGSFEGKVAIKLKEKGSTVGYIKVEKSGAWSSNSTVISANGIHPIYLRYEGRGRADMLSITLEKIVYYEGDDSNN